jgi:FMN-dependent NADH-azoreductase
LALRPRDEEKSLKIPDRLTSNLTNQVSIKLEYQETTMKQVLFIKGHPATVTTSVSLQLAEHFIKAYKAQNPDDVVTTIDLYHENIPMIDADVLSAWEKSRTGRKSETTLGEASKTHRLNELSDQFLAADKYIFAAPMWNLSYPPMVKAYVDGAVVVQGKTFTYSPKGPVGLLQGKHKKAIILEASGGQYTGTPMESRTDASNYLRDMLNFIGIDDVEIITAEGMTQFPDKRESLINAANDKAVAFASSF